MDSNLEVRSRLPWWVLLLQLSPLILQLVGEVINRTQGLPSVVGGIVPPLLTEVKQPESSDALPWKGPLDR